MPSRPRLSVFLAGEDVGYDLRRLPGGWRLTGSEVPGRRVSFDVSDAGRCTCAATGRSCPHARALVSVGLVARPYGK